MQDSIVYFDTMRTIPWNLLANELVSFLRQERTRCKSSKPNGPEKASWSSPAFHSVCGSMDVGVDMLVKAVLLRN